MVGYQLALFASSVTELARISWLSAIEGLARPAGEGIPLKEVHKSSARGISQRGGSRRSLRQALLALLLPCNYGMAKVDVLNVGGGRRLVA